MLIAPNGTGYTAVARDDGTWSGDVVRAGDLPEMVRGFISEGDAERWILAKVGRQRRPSGYSDNSVVSNTGKSKKRGAGMRRAFAL